MKRQELNPECTQSRKLKYYDEKSLILKFDILLTMDFAMIYLCSCTYFDIWLFQIIVLNTFYSAQ